ncbi:FtsX-like permease family protein [Radicibacter daui]|uniref:FtsX-like permease family protein n=1 Tax=Radicibacter daui TaxID=3064829 RepID=UPI004046D357
MRQFSHLLRLILADIRHDRVAVLCQALSLAAVLVPLMVLLGLRSGVIGTLIDRMDNDPAMRLILPEVTGSSRFDAAWFTRWRGRPEVAFVLPNTRAIAGQVDLVTAAGDSLLVSLNPTAPGDPLGGGDAVTDAGRIALTTDTARRLKVTVGDPLVIAIERTRNGRIEPASHDAVVAAILAPEKASGTGAYVTLPLLLELQSYRDGYTVPGLGDHGNGPAPSTDAFALFRLYARSIRDVAPLAADLRAEGIQVSAREGEIASTLRLDANLRAVLTIIIVAAGIGIGISLLAGQLAALRKKRRDLAVLKLIGYGPGWLAGLPIGQVVAVSLLGGLLASLFFAGTAGAINHFFADSLGSGERACRLAPAEIIMILAATLAVALPAGLIAGWQAAHVDPAEEVRDV